MKATRLIAVTALALMAGACVTMTPEERRAADEARCRSYGFRKGSDAFAKCLLDIDLDRAADRRAILDRPYGGFGPPYGYWGRPWW